MEYVRARPGGCSELELITHRHIHRRIPYIIYKVDLEDVQNVFWYHRGILADFGRESHPFRRGEHFLDRSVGVRSLNGLHALFGLSSSIASGLTQVRSVVRSFVEPFTLNRLVVRKRPIEETSPIDIPDDHHFITLGHTT
jgi:hypothetical protein